MALHFRRLLGVTTTTALLLAASVTLSRYTSADSTPIAVGGQTASAPPTFDHDVTPTLKTYCYTCHNTEKHIADLALDKLNSQSSITDNRDTWDSVSKYIRTHQMPPDGNPQPPEEARTRVSSFIDSQLFAYYTSHPDPGRVTIRRLNRNEYSHTVRDLFGVDFDAGADFPEDDIGYGFDNNGDVLTLSPVLMEKYLSAADRIVNEALPTEPPVSKLHHFPATQAEVGFNAIGDRGDGWVQLLSLEEDDVALELPLSAGDYNVRIKAFIKPTGGMLVGQGSSVPVVITGKPDPTYVGIFVGNTFVKDLEIDSTEDGVGKVYEARLGLPAGISKIRASVRRNRGGPNELMILNGRVGKQQPGIVFMKSIEVEGPLKSDVHRYLAPSLQTSGETKLDPEGHQVLETNGEVATEFNVPKEGDYLLRAEASAHQAGPDTAQMQFRINGQPVKTFDVLAPSALLPLPRQNLFDINLLAARPYVYEIKQHLPAGKVRFSAAFLNPFDDPKNTNPNLIHRNLVVNYLETVNLDGSPSIAPMPATFAEYFAHPKPGTERTDAQARDILTEFTRRAFRRDVTPADISPLLNFYNMARNDGGSFEDSLKLALKAVLVSPHFLFRGEIQPDPNNPQSVHDVSEFALASRLSYFLWSSPPDDELLAVAQRGELRKSLHAQVARMLASSKSEALVENFAGQWLQLRNLPNLAPDKQQFRDFDDGLRKAMQRETELLFNNIMRQDRPVTEFLTADYTFVNGRLAHFYGMNNVTGDEFQKVSLAGTHRMGVTTEGSLLLLTSNPTRTSPVKRGKFVLENLLGTPPPPPPPGVPVLDDSAETVGGTLRHQMEVHRQNPICASCHAQMDPIGFGLEHFDAVGKYREKDGTLPIDVAGQLKTGERFTSTEELMHILVTSRRSDYLHCITEKMMTYALGRGIEPFDRPAVETIIKNLESNDDRFSTLVIGVVDSMPFQKERGESPDQ